MKPSTILKLNETLSQNRTAVQTQNFQSLSRRVEFSCGLLTNVFAVLENATEVSAEMAQLIIANACVLPNSTIQQNSNAGDTFIKKKSKRTKH